MGEESDGAGRELGRFTLVVRYARPWWKQIGGNAHTRRSRRKRTANPSESVFVVERANKVLASARILGIVVIKAWKLFCCILAGSWVSCISSQILSIFCSSCRCRCFLPELVDFFFFFVFVEQCVCGGGGGASRVSVHFARKRRSAFRSIRWEAASLQTFKKGVTKGGVGAYRTACFSWESAVARFSRAMLGT